MENWKDIEGYEGRYQVSDQGRVRSLPNQTNKTIRILNPHKTYGYYQVALSINGKKTFFRINRLVAQAFIPNDDPEHKTQVNHINEVKTDNRACNLEWCTVTYNINYGAHNQKVAKSKSRQIKQLNIDGSLVTIWPSMSEASRNGFSLKCLFDCCNNKNKTHRGFRWAYV